MQCLSKPFDITCGATRDKHASVDAHTSLSIDCRAAIGRHLLYQHSEVVQLARPHMQRKCACLINNLPSERLFKAILRSLS